MAMMVPYQSSGSYRGMISRQLNTSGMRRTGMVPMAPRVPMAPMAPRLGSFGHCATCSGGGGPAPAPGPGLEYDTDAALPLVPYEASRHLATLSALGDLGATALINQGITGVKAGTAAAGLTSSIGAGVASAVGAGAAAGSVVPIIGTAIGAIVGLLASGVLSRKKDPEAANFDQAVALYRQNPQNVINIADKYLVLAGLFDLRADQIKGNIPIYKRYGRMGEQRFVTDMVSRIYQAGLSGQITANDTPQSVFAKVVQPWIDSFGYGPMTDSNADMITLILLGMTAEYLAGMQTRWQAIGGDNPFTSLPKFALPQPIAPPPPVPAYAAPAPVATPTCAPGYTWNGSQCVAPLPPTTPTPGAVVAVPVTPTPTATPTRNVQPVAPVPSALPSGFTPVSADANGQTIFASPQGVLYQWNGQAFAQYTGSVGSGASVAAQVQAAIQTALAQGYTPAQAAQSAVAQTQASGTVVPPAIVTQAADQAAVTAAAPQATAAAFGGTGMLGILIAGGILVSLAFAGRSRGRA